MNNLIVNSIKKFLEVSNLTNDIYNYLNFYDELRELKEVKLIYTELQKWFEKTFGAKSLRISIYSTVENTKEIAFQNSPDDIYKNASLCKYYKIDMNPNLIITFCLVCDTKEQYELVTKKDEYLNTLFYMVSPLISSVSYQELVKELAFKDSLTNVYNRKFLVEHLNKLLPLAKRENRNISFLMVGIDHFRAVIDEFDYDIGDKVLINLSTILLNNVRESDLVVRLEADEFLIALVGLTNQKDALFVAEKLVKAFAESEVVVNDHGHVLKKTICVGITHYDYETKTVDEILKNADNSLEEAKNLGRSQVKEYIPEFGTFVELF
ncbi:MAG: GGDEF domain-containing protein [Arcobacteraceae bacterium]